MKQTIDDIRLSNLRKCVMIIITNLAFYDLDAASKEHAQTVIHEVARRHCPPYIDRELVGEAATRVASCLEWN